MHRVIIKVGALPPIFNINYKRNNSLGDVNSNLPINVGGLTTETLSDLDPSGNYFGYLNDSYNSNQYLFRQFSDGIFSARIIIKNGTSTRIGIMACYVPTGYDGRGWSWFDPVS